MLSKEPLPGHQSIIGAIASFASTTPDAFALLGPDHTPVTYGTLFHTITSIQEKLTSFGIHREDRVALVMPNGIDMAMTFLGILSTAALAPLNPAYRSKEFDFYLSDTQSAALVTDSSLDSAATEVAESRNLQVIEVSEILTINTQTSATTSMGHFDKTGQMPLGEDLAIILHTSGTTSRPKSVPLSHSNLMVSADNVARSLTLSSEDRCLNIMPLFHVHGMIGALLSSLSVGASTFCSPGFEPMRFFQWMEDIQPTWYSGVPTMHHILSKRADANLELLNRSSLRFIRSCSAALPPQVMADLETKFQVPVIEAYGMTEAAHQIASNPLPPLNRKPGTVGIPTGPEVAIMDEKGELLELGETGEIVIRGPNVTSGYENNPDANRESFTHGWFRTGDEGYLDTDGFLTISGRIKEIINRGGEKISPREIDEVLLRHPDIDQAVVFPIPHPSLGEDLAAAIVLREGATLTEAEIQHHVGKHLAKFKVPRTIFIVEEIPKGPTGKIQRLTLHDKLSLGSG